MTEIEIVAENLRRLLAHAQDSRVTWPKSFKALAVRSTVDRETIARTIKGKTAVGIDNLGKIAAPFGMDAWQLLVRGLDPARPPRVLMTELRHGKGRPNARTTDDDHPAPVAGGGKAHGASAKASSKRPAKSRPRSGKTAGKTA